MSGDSVTPYIPGGTGSQELEMMGMVVIICAVVLLLIFLTIFLISVINRKKLEKKRENIGNDRSYSSITDLEKEEFQKHCINPAEKPLAVIGNRGLKQYLVKEDEVEAFSVVTNRRVYFKGAYLRKNEKGKLETCRDDLTVDNYEIKKVEIITERPVWPIIMASAAAILEIAGIVFIFVNKVIGNI